MWYNGKGHALNGNINGWIEKEFSTLRFGSERLERRFKIAMSDWAEQPELSTWLASGSRANAKAVYRMMGNERFSKEEILAAHREATKARAEEKILLAIQDTMSVNYDGHEKTVGMGYCCEQTLGINIHSCLLLTTQGIPLGLISQSAVTRELSADKSRSKSQKRFRPIEEKESYRWLETMGTARKNAPDGVTLVHIADREGDIYELFALASRTEQKFVIRVIHNRMTLDGEHVLDKLRASELKGKLKIVVPENHQKKSKEREAVLELRYGAFDVKKPQIRKNNNELEDSLRLNLISLKEVNPPESEERIEWILMTNLDLETADNVLAAIDLYRHRWKIERFHFVLKSGCKIEKIQQHSVDRIEMMILFYSIIAVHIMQLTYIARSFPDTPCELIFSESEWKTLYRAANLTQQAPDSPYSMVDAVRYVAKLGGFVGAKSDGPPGLKVIWLGINKLFILCAYRDFI